VASLSLETEETSSGDRASIKSEHTRTPVSSDQEIDDDLSSDFSEDSEEDVQDYRQGKR
jgi:hypothetical protein